MKLLYYLSLLFILVCSSSLSAQGIEERVLDAIEKTEEYDAQKKARINAYREQLKGLEKTDTLQRYNLNRELYNEYRIFKQDSAYIGP